MYREGAITPYLCGIADSGACEYAQLRLFEHSSEELIRSLRELGYRCVIRKNGTRRDLCEEDLDTDLAFNVIAIR